MIKSARLGKEITVTVVNKIGVLEDMSKLLAEHAINIIGLAGYAMNKEAKIMLVTEDNLRAADALKKSGYKLLNENEVLIIELENKVGALKLITEKLLAQDIDIKQVYGTTCAASCPAILILSTSDNEKAIVAFKS
jgi:hypothetical protein